MARKTKANPLPDCPFETGKPLRVKVRATGELVDGIVTCAFWVSFPGQWIPEVKATDGRVYGIGGHAIPISGYGTVEEVF